MKKSFTKAHALVRQAVVLSLAVTAFAAMSSALGGCAYMLVNRLDEMEKMERDSTRKPVYISNARTIDSIVNSARFSADSSKARPGSRAARISPADAANRSDSTAVKSSAQIAPWRGNGKNSVLQSTPDTLLTDYKLKILKILSDGYPDSVEVRAIVLDGHGNCITGLAPPYLAPGTAISKYWKVPADSCRGNLFLPNEFRVEEVRTNTSKPQALAFTLDHSGSMGDVKIYMLQMATKALLGALKPDDWAAVVKFGTKVCVELPLTNDRTKIRYDSIVAPWNSVKYGGGMGNYPAMIEAIKLLKELRDPRYEKLIILFSDGMGGNDNKMIDSIFRGAIADKIAIYPVCFGTGDEVLLGKFAEYTGGRFYKINSLKELPGVFKDIYLSANNYYRVIYKPKECPGIHEVRLGASLPGRAGLVTAEGIYDKSIISRYSPVGSVLFTDIEFDFGKDGIRPESEGIIAQVAQSLKNNPEMKIKIAGHTDDIGDETSNLKLSARRAESVKRRLVELGIPERRISTAGYGEGRPLVPNSSDENRRRNRRTEFIIIER